jgi:hypothetical protein
MTRMLSDKDWLVGFLKEDLPAVRHVFVPCEALGGFYVRVSKNEIRTAVEQCIEALDNPDEDPVFNQDFIIDEHNDLYFDVLTEADFNERADAYSRPDTPDEGRILGEQERTESANADSPAATAVAGEGSVPGHPEGPTDGDREDEAPHPV